MLPRPPARRLQLVPMRRLHVHVSLVRPWRALSRSGQRLGGIGNHDVGIGGAGSFFSASGLNYNAVLGTGSGGSSAPASPNGASRFAESFRFKNHPEESPLSRTSAEGEYNDGPPSRLISNFL